MRGFICSVGVGLIGLATAQILILLGAPVEAQGFVLVGIIGLGLITGALSSQRADR